MLFAFKFRLHRLPTDHAKALAYPHGVSIQSAT